MKFLTVELGERSYPIYIASDALRHHELLSDLKSYSRILVVSNTTVAPLYLDVLNSTLVQAGCRGVQSLVLPDGEEYKNRQTLEQIYDFLLHHGYERNSLLIALGGGVIGDMTGFAAATYQRGISFIQVPTTLLAQVDSSVGGKTGINHPLGKNMIGAFYQPKKVIIDTRTLKTLPLRELSAGLAEIIKYGLISDVAFFDWLEANISRLLADEEDAISFAIERSCAIKAGIVGTDEKESGDRALLNLGLTFGHAIEAHLGFGHVLHGEAVAAGIVVAVRLSRLMGWLREEEVSRTIELLRRAHLPTTIPAGMQPADFFHFMRHDKKVKQGNIRYILLKELGHATIVANAEDRMVAEAIELCRT